VGNVNLLREKASGQAFLSTILIIGGVMVFVGAAVAFLAMTFIDSGYGLQSSNLAESVATAGVNDAYLHLVRNSSFAIATTTNFTSLSSGSATVTVTQGSPTTSQVMVFSSATVGGRTRKIMAIFLVASSTGQVTIGSWQDVQ
jgi:hypothetical protein